jgi:hypothetical protein
MVTSSLLMDGKPSELGFFDVLSVEPIYSCLAWHKLLPECQAEGWDDFWNLDEEYFYRPSIKTAHGGLQVAASVALFDNGKRFYIEITSDDQDILAHVLERSTECLSPVVIRRHEVRPGMVQLHVDQPTADTRPKLEAARQAARETFIQADYAPIS